MAVKIRLARRGRKKRAMYDVVIAESRNARDGRFIEKIGTYNPNTNPATILLDESKAFKWVMNGAIPTDTVKAMLSYRGILFKKHLQIGVLKGAISQEQADAKFDAWKEQKDTKVTGKVDQLAKDKASSAKARFDAEAKVKDDRAKALAAKKAEAEQVVTETPTENAETVENTEITPEVTTENTETTSPE
jgi:small subunit ribosomal protein S16